MPVLTINVSNAASQRFLDAINYQATIKDPITQNMIPNPISPLQASKDWVLQQVKSQILQHEAIIASETARKNKLNEDLSDIN